MLRSPESSPSPRRISGSGRALVAVYGILAIAATGRSVLQIATRFEEAPLAYSLSAAAAVVWCVGGCVATGIAVTHVMATRVAGGPGGGSSSSASDGSVVPPPVFVRFPSGLRITAWHPVWLSAEEVAALPEPPRQGAGWVFPARTGLLAEFADDGVRAVYTFALEGGAPAFEADGVCAIALAHGLTDDPVAAHPFFGTRRVLEALEAAADVVEGGVHMLPAGAAVAGAGGLVDGFVVAGKQREEEEEEGVVPSHEARARGGSATEVM